ncbi:hypothetical protein OG381_24525 [Streptomyces sp. NBC_00490]|uniref:hypothetical protein n=1 Tax=Streptomyces sp. NBC_00490 TaxID=2903657 RepID=UPI002E197C3F
MTRWLRTVRTTGLVIALGAGAVAVPCGAGTSYGAEAVRGGEPAHDAWKSAFAPTAQEGRAATDRPGWARGGAVGPGMRYVPSASPVPGGQAAPGVRGSATASAVPDTSVTPRAVNAPSEPALHGSRPVPRAEATASPSAEPSRAGSRAGEGRERPGRREAAETGEEDAGAGVGSESEAEPPADGDATVVAEPSREAVPDASPPPQRPGRQGVTRAESPTEPVLRILPLGSGLVLIGLGLGLAFVGLRVRRG